MLTHVQKTLIVVIRRYEYRYFGTVKLQNAVHVNEELSIRTASKHDIQYELKSAVCHNGNTARGGHYTSMVRKGNQYICCNDSLIEIRPSDDLLETAYILVYDKVNEEIPHFVAPFLSCFKATLGLQQVLEDKRSQNIPKRKFEMLSSLNSKGSIDNLEQKFSVICGSKFDNEQDKQKLVELFYELFIKHMFYVDGTGPTLSTEYYEVPSKHIFKCYNGMYDVHNQNQLIITIKSEIENQKAFSDTLKLPSGPRVLTQCKCGSSDQKGLFCSLPSTLIFHVENTQNLKASLVRSLGFQTSIDECYDLNSTRYG